MIETLTSILTIDQLVNQATSPLFYYRNATGQIQIISFDRAMPERFEKVVFPGEQLLFYATSEAILNIYTRTATTLTLIEQISCSQLRVLEEV